MDAIKRKELLVRYAKVLQDFGKELEDASKSVVPLAFTDDNLLPMLSEVIGAINSNGVYTLRAMQFSPESVIKEVKARLAAEVQKQKKG